MLSRTRWTPAPDPKSALPLQALGPRAEGTMDGSSRPKPLSGLKPEEEALAAYLLARAALHRKIEGPALAHLRAGHDSVQEVGALFPLGRSNVREDIGITKDAHTPLRTHASYDLHGALISRQRYPRGTKAPENEIYQMAAAAGQYALTGTCFFYATSTTPLHAAKLAGMGDERAIVAQSKHATIDHVWCEVLPRGKREDGQPILHGEDVILDGWCQEKLAVLREDSHFARLGQDGNGDHLSHAHLLDHRSGAKAWENVEMFKAQIDGSRALRFVFHDQLENLMAEGVQVEEKCLWDAQSVFHEDFREAAIAALHKDDGKPAPGMYGFIPGVDPLANRAKRAAVPEIQAVGVARSLGADIRGAVAEAPRIIASAREMFPRPESKNEGFLARISAFFQH